MGSFVKTWSGDRYARLQKTVERLIAEPDLLLNAMSARGDPIEQGDAGNKLSLL